MEHIPEEANGIQGSGGQDQDWKARGTPLLKQEKGKRASVGREVCGWRGILSGELSGKT